MANTGAFTLCEQTETVQITTTDDFRYFLRYHRSLFRSVLVWKNARNDGWEVLEYVPEKRFFYLGTSGVFRHGSNLREVKLAARMRCDIPYNGEYPDRDRLARRFKNHSENADDILFGETVTGTAREFLWFVPVQNKQEKIIQ